MVSSSEIDIRDRREVRDRNPLQKRNVGGLGNIPCPNDPDVEKSPFDHLAPHNSRLSAPILLMNETLSRMKVATVYSGIARRGRIPATLAIPDGLANIVI